MKQNLNDNFIVTFKSPIALPTNPTFWSSHLIGSMKRDTTSSSDLSNGADDSYDYLVFGILNSDSDSDLGQPKNIRYKLHQHALNTRQLSRRKNFSPIDQSIDESITVLDIESRDPNNHKDLRIIEDPRN